MNPGLRRGTILLRLGHQRTFGLLQTEAVGDILRHRLDLNADPTARHRTTLLELRDDRLDGVGGDREGDADRAARRREDRRVDADHVAVGVEGRATRVALVHRRVDLDEVVIGAGADVTAARRHDARGDGSAETERIADCDDPVADTRRRVSQLHIGERTALDLDQREIAARIGADDFRGVGLAVVGRDLNAFGLVHDVIVGHGITVGRDEEARALTGDGVMPAAARRHAFGAVLTIWHAEATEEFLQARRHVFHVLAAETVGLRSAVDLDANRHHRRFHFLDDIGKARRRGDLLGLLGEVLRKSRRVAALEVQAGADDQRAEAKAGDGGGEQNGAAD